MRRGMTVQCAEVIVVQGEAGVIAGPDAHRVRTRHALHSPTICTGEQSIRAILKHEDLLNPSHCSFQAELLTTFQAT